MPFIAVVDGLRGFPEAIEAVYPQAWIQTCIVHLIRNPTTLAAWKDRKKLAATLKPIYQAANADLAAAALDTFAAGPWEANSRQWRQCDNVNGNKSFRSLPIRPRLGRSSVQPTPLTVCICACARSSRTGATSPATRPLPRSGVGLLYRFAAD
jgi:hypothetical protein